MDKEEEKKKKKELSNLIFKIVFALAILFLIFSIIKSPLANFSISDNKLRTHKIKKRTNDEKPVPGPLKWQDSFKGVSNSPKKKEEKGKYFN